MYWFRWNYSFQDLFIAGSETAASTLSFAILHMILRPDIQTRIHREIDEHVGSVRQISQKLEREQH